MPQLTVDLPASLVAALDQEAEQGGCSRASLIVEAVSRYLDKPVNTVFQVSTSGALVAGVYDREVSVRTIREHGDFGLGTFAGLVHTAWVPSAAFIKSCPDRILRKKTA